MSAAERRSSVFDIVVPDKIHYLTPLADDKCPLLECPEEVLVKVFAKLGRRDISRCRRVSRTLVANHLYCPQDALQDQS
jgi:hypothetical protein